ncbi:MAG: UDP-N-acetylmuramate--L-alanine ligase [Bdellovibrionales bacterium]|nr:UDP-N-acetylmuramate--L-alanine ligase [Bdellovibrionales bacterium]
MRLAQSKVHFIGIGGIGMCGLAELLHNMGAEVSGSDLSENKQVKYLKELGVKVFIGQEAAQVIDQDVVVYSSAIPNSNPELQQAKKLGIPLIPRAEALAEMMRFRRGIAVGGTHGKTTTTSLLASLFLQAGLDPTAVVGGRLDLFKSTAKLGSGEWFIAEADESDGSFHKLSPENVIITNIDNDHLDHYQSFENIQKAFYEFALKIPFYGTAILYGDDPLIRKVFEAFPKRKLFYGFQEDNDYRVAKEGSTGEIYFQGQKIAHMEFPMPGKHNALNALASFIAGQVAGLTVDQCVSGLEGFQGVDRRFQKKFDTNNVLIYDDYGHHPTEVKAVLQAAQERFPERRKVVVFQPHRYSRTRDCFEEFTQSFSEADVLVLLDIYPAGEQELPGISSRHLGERIHGTKVNYVGSFSDALNFLEKNLKDNDFLLTLGAGDVWKLGEQIHEVLYAQ